MFGHELLLTNTDDYEYGEHLILAPEEDHIAKEYSEKGHSIFTVYEESEPDGDEFVEVGLELGSSPYKVGYLVLKK
jgi:hypothetical protein